MRKQLTHVLVFLLLAMPFQSAWAERFQETIEVFRNAGESGSFFDNSYGYAVSPLWAGPA